MNATVKAKMTKVHDRLQAAWRNLLARLREYADRMNDRVDERLDRLHRRHSRR